MNSSEAITFMIAICVIILIYMVLANQFNYILKCLIRSAMCMGLISILNYFLAPFGYLMGVNMINAFIVGILGLPGVVLLYVSNMIL